MFSAGKYLHLTKWSKKDKLYEFSKVKSTQESRQGPNTAFKSVCLLQDPKGNLWIHDVLTKRLLCYSPDLQLLGSFQGHTITLCNLPLTPVFQEDAAIVGTQTPQSSPHLVWYMGKRSLGIVDIAARNNNPVSGKNKSDGMTVVGNFSDNTIVRKILGCKLSQRAVILEIAVDVHDVDDRKTTEVNCFDVALMRSVFKKRLGTDEPPGIVKYTKSIELSVSEEYLFSVGVYIDGSDPDTITQKGFINAMKLNATLKECNLVTIGTASHPEKKGMYRVHRVPSSDTLVVSSWTDVFVYRFEGGAFTHLHSFLRLHDNLIYNVVATDKGFYTCSNDCEAGFIEF